MSLQFIFSIVPGVLLKPSITFQVVKDHSISIIRFFLLFGLPFILMGSFGRALCDQNLEVFVNRPLGLLFLIHLFSNFLALLLGSYMVALLSGTYGLPPDYSQSLKLSLTSYIPFLISQLLAALAPVINFIAFAGIAYSVILFWRGAPIILKIPRDRLTGFTFMAFFIFMGMSLIGIFLLRLIIFATVSSF